MFNEMFQVALDVLFSLFAFEVQVSRDLLKYVFNIVQ